MLDDGRSEVDDDVIGRVESFGDLLAVDADRDARVAETGIDREIDDTFEVALWIAIAAQEELRRRECGRCEEEEENCYCRFHRSAGTRIGSV